MGNTILTRQELQDMCKGQVPAGTKQPIEGTDEVMLYMRNGIKLQVPEELADIMIHDIMEKAL